MELFSQQYGSGEDHLITGGGVHRNEVRALASQIERISEHLAQRDEHVARLTDEVRDLKDDRAMLFGEIERLERALRRLGTAPSGRSTGRTELRHLGIQPRARSARVEAPVPARGPDRAPALARPAAAAPPRAELVYFDDQVGMSDVLRKTADRWCASCVPGADVGAADPARPRLLAVNLLAHVHHLEAAQKWLQAEKAPPTCLYCSDGGHGFSFGLVDILLPPFEPARWLGRLRPAARSARHVLVVSEDLETVESMRRAMKDTQRTVSSAMDAHQAVQLISAVKPDAIWIDLHLARGGLKLAARLRAAEKTQATPLTFFAARPINWSVLQIRALMAVRDTRFSGQTLERELSRALNELPAR